MKNTTLIPTLIFEDNHLVVLSKPPGLLSQGEHTGQPHLVDWLKVHFGRNYVGLIHRLDRNTSGLMVVAKRSKSAQRLTDALQSNQIERKYLAWLLGELRHSETWQHYLEKNSSTNEVKVVRGNHEKGKFAQLTVTPQKQSLYKGYAITLAEFSLETGRSHQIRVQSAYQKYPLLGDTKYGQLSQPHFTRTALHSYYLKFPHPMSGEILYFEDPLPPDLNL